MTEVIDKQYAGKNTPKRKLNKFTMSEISVVGTPAQEPALIAITKSAAEEIEMDAEAQNKLEKQVEDLNKAVIAQTATITRLNAVNVMSSDVRKYFDALAETDQVEFITKSVAIQEAEVQNAQLANAVIHKDRNGIEYRKDDDPRLVQMAKDADEQAKSIKKMQEDNSDLRLQKMVDEYKFLPGTDEARTALVKAVDGISDAELKKSAFEILKSKNANNGRMFQTTGTTGNGSAELEKGNVETEFDDLIKKNLEANPGIIEEQAWDNVLQTAEGAAAYEKYEQARPH